MKTILVYSQPNFEAARLRAVAEVTDQHFNADLTLKDEHLRDLFETLFKAEPRVLWEESLYPVVYMAKGIPQREETWGIKPTGCTKPCRHRVALTNGTVMELTSWPDYADLLSIKL